MNTSIVGVYTITYKKVDMSGNRATLTRTITVVDLTPPLVTLMGSGILTIAQGSTYTDSGASWTDNVDGTGNTLTGMY